MANESVNILAVRVSRVSSSQRLHSLLLQDVNGSVCLCSSAVLDAVYQTAPCRIPEGYKIRVLETRLAGDNSSVVSRQRYYEGWNFNSGNYLFTTDTK